jgi:hypothetical protein
MNESLRYDSGLGNNEVYARVVHNSSFWDFSTLSWQVTETQTCRVSLTETVTNTDGTSWYVGAFNSPPGGIFPVEIVRVSTGAIIGNDITQNDTTITSPKSIYQSLAYDKGLGSAEVYVRLLSGARFWDFQNKTWSAWETSACRVFLSEFDASAIGWYYAIIVPPYGGPFPVEIVRVSTGDVIGNDIAWGDTTPSSTTPVTPTKGTVKCIDILTVASRQLQDILNITWPLPILLSYLNYAVREIINNKPDAGSVVSNLVTVAGTRQTIPADWLSLLDVKRNMGTDGLTPGLAITQIPKALMESALPDWHMWTSDVVARHVIFDPRDPFSFDVFPPQPTGTAQNIESLGVKYPDKVTDPANDLFPLTDNYEVPAEAYVVYMALNESTTIPNALQKAAAMYQKFQQYLGIKTQEDVKDQAQGV